MKEFIFFFNRSDALIRDVVTVHLSTCICPREVGINFGSRSLTMLLLVKTSITDFWLWRGRIL